jgi:predicted nucleic acid-binding protein
MPASDSGGPPDALVDTSVAVAIALTGHEGHASALRAVAGLRLGLAGHAWFETYSVLTRLPPGVRRSPADILRLLDHDFPASRFLDADTLKGLGAELARLGIGGGSVYDALVGATARHHQVRLLSRDRRASTVYDALGVDVTLID